MGLSNADKAKRQDWRNHGNALHQGIRPAGGPGSGYCDWSDLHRGGSDRNPEWARNPPHPAARPDEYC